jgi:hypothetical protein
MEIPADIPALMDPVWYVSGSLLKFKLLYPKVWIFKVGP